MVRWDAAIGQQIVVIGISPSRIRALSNSFKSALVIRGFVA